MALDTRSKRASAIGLMLPFVLNLPAPDGTVAAGDRQHLAHAYSGIPSVANLDTRAKRASGLRVGRPWFNVQPLPDGTVAYVDRALGAMAYSGIAAGIAAPTGVVDIRINANAYGTSLGFGTAAVIILGQGITVAGPSGSADVTITASAVGDVIESLGPATVSAVVTASPVLLGFGTASVAVTAAAPSVKLASGTANLAVTAAASASGGPASGQGVGSADVAVNVTAAGTFAARGIEALVAMTSTALGTLLASASVQVSIDAAATGDDGVPDPVTGTATVTIGASAIGSLIAPAPAATPVPSAKVIDFKSISDYYNARAPRVAVYTFSSGRKFFESGN